MSDTASPQHVKSAMRTLDIIEYVVANDRGVNAQEVSRALNIPISSLSYLLGTLVERAYLLREGRLYRVGPGLERLQVRSSEFTLAERAAPLVSSLRMQLNETASFFIRRDWEVETLATATSEQALRYSVAEGSRSPMHTMSAGKAILSSLPDSDVDAYLEQVDRTAMTPTTITEADILRDEIALTRQRGYALTNEEHTVGIRGVGRAVVAKGELLGAFGVAVPTVRYSSALEQRVVDVLARTTAILEAG